MRREEAMELASNGLEELSKALAQGKSESLIEYLDVMARFPSYSFRNSLLIVMQRPTATQVAGYRQWEKLGRNVRKGEKGITILAPLVYKRKLDGDCKDGERREEASDGTPGKVVRGFRAVHVFDVGQTEGKPLPEFAKVEGEPGDWLGKLEAVVRDAEIELEYVDYLNGADGLSQGDRISVLADLGVAEKFFVLAHEYAHELLHKGERRKQTDKRVRETEAEAVGFVVARAIGLDAATHASDYIQLYRGDAETLQESLHFIQQTAAGIIESLHRADLADQLDAATQRAVKAEWEVSHG